MLLCNIRNHAHFILVQHHAGGIARIGNQNGAGIPGNLTLNPLPLGIAISFPGIGGKRTDDTASCMAPG